MATSGLAGGDLHVGANGNARNRHRLLGAYDAYRERMRVLSQQEDLLAGIDQAADGSTESSLLM